MGYVYALQFDDLAIKVGQAVDAVRRIGTHQTEAARFGHRIVRVWSVEVSRPSEAEDLLIAHCLSRGTARPGTREYFTGVPWDSSKWDALVSQELSHEVSRGVSQSQQGIRRVVLEGILDGVSTTAELLDLAKDAGFTGESWFFIALKDLQADGLIRRGVRKGIYEIVNGE